MKAPFYGWRRMTGHLIRLGFGVNGKRVRRLMHKMGLQALYARPKTSKPDREHKIYPYLLRGPDQVWSSDITYIPMKHGFMYLVAIIDWFSRYVLSFEISNSLDVHFCLRCLERALGFGRPEIFNTDQGAQFTSRSFTAPLEEAGIRVSMDGRGRALDNVFIERLWRSVKQEDIYLKDYETGEALIRGLHRYFKFYNHERVHQSLGYTTPADIYFGNPEESREVIAMAGAARNGSRSGKLERNDPPYFTRSVV